MSISLVKGQKIDLTKGNAGLRKVLIVIMKMKQCSMR